MFQELSDERDCLQTKTKLSVTFDYTEDAGVGLELIPADLFYDQDYFVFRIIRPLKGEHCFSYIPEKILSSQQPVQSFDLYKLYLNCICTGCP